MNRMIFVPVIIAIVIAATMATATIITSAFAQSSFKNFGQCQKAQIERFGTHDFVHDFCNGVP